VCISCYIRLLGTWWNYVSSIRSSGKRGVCVQRLHESLRVTITLGSIGLVRDLSNGSDILRGELDLPSIYILLEVLPYIYRLSRYSRLIWSQYRTYRKFGGTRDRDDVLSLSQHPRQRDLPGSGVILFADLLQAVRQLEDVGEVLPGVPRDVFTEVTLLKVVGRFLQVIRCVILSYCPVIIGLRSGR
jgi:hypothetical protein